MDTHVNTDLLTPGSGPSLRPNGLTGFFGLLGVLGDVVLGPSVCEDQSDPRDVAFGGTAALRL